MKQQRQDVPLVVILTCSVAVSKLALLVQAEREPSPDLPRSPDVSDDADVRDITRDLPPKMLTPGKC